MKLGFNSMCLADNSLEQLISFAAIHGFQAVELVLKSPASNNLGLSIEDFSIDKNDTVKKLLQQNRVEISCFGFYSNPLAGEAEKQFFNQSMYKIIDACNSLGVRNVSTFTGYDPSLSLTENLEEFARILKPLLNYAKEKNVNILLENTPLLTGEKNQGNFAYSPQIWDAIFTLLPQENFGLNYDPSHLFWLGIDYLLFLKVFKERILHVQAKDSEILLEHLRMTGIMGENWFRYRLPGSGAIEWRKFFPALFEIGFEGVISLELNDPIWQDTEEKIKRGLLLGKKTLESFII